MRLRSSLLALASLAMACSPAPESPRPPPGLFLAGEAEAVRSLADALAGLRGTPVARAAARLRAAVEGCEEVVAHAPSGELADLTAGLGCRTRPLPTAIRAAREGADLIFSAPMGVDGHSISTLRIAPNGSIAAEITIDPPPGTGPLAFLLPGDEPAAAGFLSDRDALLHVRLRPAGGLDLGSWVGPASQADSLFQLKSELFAGAALEGSIEIVSYLPQPGRSMPGLALGVGLRLRAAAVAGMERFIADLESTWPIRHTPMALGDAPGACFLELRILPEFAPCYVATDDALVVAWNRASLEEALAPASGAAPAAAAGPELVVELARLGEADERLQAALAPDAAADPLVYPWERLVVQRRRAPGPLALEVALVAAAGP